MYIDIKTLDDMENLSDSEIKQILEAVAEAYMPNGHRNIASIFTYPNNNGIINDLKREGKSYDFSKEEDVIRAARDAFDNNLDYLRIEHNIAEKDISVSSREAFLYTLVLGHKGSIPYLNGRELKHAELRQIKEFLIDEEIQQEEVSAVSSSTEEVSVIEGDVENSIDVNTHAEMLTDAKKLPFLESKNFQIEYTQALPEIELPEILSKKEKKELEQQAEIKEDDNLIKIHNMIVNGVTKTGKTLSPKLRSRLIPSISREIKEDTGLNINPYLHDPENTSTISEIALASSLSKTSLAFGILPEIYDSHGAAPNFTTTKQGPQWQSPLYGYAEGFNIKKTDPELYKSNNVMKRVHYDEFHHSHNNPNFVSSFYSTEEGLELSGNKNLYDEKGNSAILAAHISGEEQEAKFFSYENLEGDKSYKGLSFQANIANNDEAFSFDASTMLYSSFPSLTLGVGPVIGIRAGDKNLSEKFGARFDVSLLDPVSGKTGIRLFSDITNQAASGELSLASETMDLDKARYHLSYNFNFPYNGEESEQEIHGKFLYPVTRKVLLQNEAEIEFGEGWKNRLSAINALNEKVAVGGSVEIGNMSGGGDLDFENISNTNIEGKKLNVNLAAEASYINIGAGVTGGIEVGIQEVGSQNIPYGNVRVTKILGQ